MLWRIQGVGRRKYDYIVMIIFHHTHMKFSKLKKKCKKP